MGKKFILAGAFAALLVTAAFLTGCQTSGVTTSGSANQQTGIWVNGQGKVSAAPDLATVDLGISTKANTVGEAQSQAQDAMNKVMASLAANGVAQKDIQTRVFNVQQLTRFDDKTQEQVVLGYQVTNTVTVKIRDLTNAGTIVDGAVTAGGDFARVNGISFSIEDPIHFNDVARQKAVADAQDKAKSLADLTGVKLGKPTFISENSFSTPPPSPIFAAGKAADVASTPISPGEEDIVVNIQVVYSIR